MGERSETVSRGVRVRSYRSGKRAIEIQFQFKAVQCREVLRGLEVTQANLRYAANLKAEIESHISRNTFRYTDYFPTSPKARVFGHAVSTATVETLLRAWLADIDRAYPHSTARAYRKSCTSVLIPALGKFRLVDLSPEHVREMIRSRHVTLKTLRNDLTPLRAVLDRALIDGLIDRNPMDRIKVAKLADRRKRSTYTADPFTADEIAALLGAAAEHRPEWLAYWQFAFYSGLRTSEQYGLMWADIDWPNRQANVLRAVVERVVKETKTKAGARAIDLLPAAYAALKRQQPHTYLLKPGYVFINPHTRQPIRDYEETGRLFQRLCALASVRYRNQYQTRHTYASQMLSGGENVYYVAQQLGHRDISMVISVYGKWIKQDRVQHVSAFATQGLPGE